MSAWNRLALSLGAALIVAASWLALGGQASAQANACLCKGRPEGGLTPPTPACVVSSSFTIVRYDGRCFFPTQCNQPARMCQFVPRIRALGVDQSCVFAVTVDNVPQIAPQAGSLNYAPLAGLNVPCNNNRVLRVFAGPQLLMGWNLRCIQCPAGGPVAPPPPPVGPGGGPGGDGGDGGGGG